LLELLTGREMCRGSGFAILCWRFCCLLLGRDSFTVLYYLKIIAFVHLESTHLLQSRSGTFEGWHFPDFHTCFYFASFGFSDFVDMEARMKVVQHFTGLLMITLHTHQRVITNAKQKIAAHICKVQRDNIKKLSNQMTVAARNRTLCVYS
jgi:hypothetical protein